MGNLVLGFKEGESFYLNDLKCTVTNISSPQSYKVVVHKSWDEIVTVDSAHDQELTAGVFASAGANTDWAQARILIKAPKHVVILRDRLYKRKKLEESKVG